MNNTGLRANNPLHLYAKVILLTFQSHVSHAVQHNNNNTLKLGWNDGKNGLAINGKKTKEIKGKKGKSKRKKLRVRRKKEREKKIKKEDEKDSNKNK